jgi:hypothetical protein
MITECGEQKFTFRFQAHPIINGLGQPAILVIKIVSKNRKKVNLWILADSIDHFRALVERVPSFTI